MIRKISILSLTLLAVGTCLLGIVTSWVPLWKAYGSGANFRRIYIADGVAEISYSYVGDLWASFQQRQQRLGKISVTWVDNRERRFGWAGVTWDVSYGGGKGGWIGGRWPRSCGVRHVNDPPETAPKAPVFVAPTIDVVHQLRLPLWGVVFILGFYPFVSVTANAVFRSRRRKRGLCVKCGYDLTGNESGVCPECGRSITNLTAKPRAER